jgi:hypothetical protein
LSGWWQESPAGVLVDVLLLVSALNHQDGNVVVTLDVRVSCKLCVRARAVGFRLRGVSCPSGIAQTIHLSEPKALLSGLTIQSLASCKG